MCTVPSVTYVSGRSGSFLTVLLSESYEFQTFAHRWEKIVQPYKFLRYFTDSLHLIRSLAASMCPRPWGLDR